MSLPTHAVVAELADAQDSGSCGRKLVEVQVLSTAPNGKLRSMAQFFCCHDKGDAAERKLERNFLAIRN
jgi:hypothetical protein